MAGRLDGLSLGCAVAAAIGIPAAKQWLARWWRMMAWTSAGVLVLGFMALKVNYLPGDKRAEIIAVPAVTVLTAALVFAASSKLLSARLNAFLSNRVLVYFGKRSYGLYLIHWPLLSFLSAWSEKAFQGSTPGARTLFTSAAVLAGIAVSVALAELSWRLIEQPAQGLKKRLFKDRREEAAGVSLVVS